MATTPKAKAKPKLQPTTTPAADSRTATIALRNQATALRDQAESLLALMNHLWGPAPAPAPSGGILIAKVAGGAPPPPAPGKPS